MTFLGLRTFAMQDWAFVVAEEDRLEGTQSRKDPRAGLFVGHGFDGCGVHGELVLKLSIDR